MAKRDGDAAGGDEGDPYDFSDDEGVSGIVLTAMVGGEVSDFLLQHGGRTGQNRAIPFLVDRTLSDALADVPELFDYTAFRRAALARPAAPPPAPYPSAEPSRPHLSGAASGVGGAAAGDAAGDADDVSFDLHDERRGPADSLFDPIVACPPAPHPSASGAALGGGGVADGAACADLVALDARTHDPPPPPSFWQTARRSRQ